MLKISNNKIIYKEMGIYIDTSILHTTLYNCIPVFGVCWWVGLARARSNIHAITECGTLYMFRMFCIDYKLYSCKLYLLGYYVTFLPFQICSRFC